MTIEVDGVPFLVRRITTPVAVKVLGSKAMGLVRGAMSKGKSKATEQENMAVVREYLAECMIEPRLGDETNASNGVISFEDLGDLGPQLFAEIMRESGWMDQVADFPRPSEGETG